MNKPVTFTGIRISEINAARVEQFREALLTIAYRNTYVSKKSQTEMVGRIVNACCHFMSNRDTAAPMMQEACEALGIYPTPESVQAFLSGK